MKVRYRLVYFKKRNLSGDNSAVIQVEASQCGCKKYFSTGVYVMPDHWDNKKKKIIGHPNADMLNAYLFEFIINIERVELNLWKRGVSPTLNLIKEHLNSGNELSGSFKEICRNVILDSSRCISTKKNLMSTLNSLIKFRQDFTWSDINYAFLQQFELRLNRQRFAKNTVIKHLRNLRTLLNEAVLLGHLSAENNPFGVFKIPQHISQHIFLCSDELQRLENLCPDGYLMHVRDAFLFCCYTGLRFSDFCLLKSNCFLNENGCLWLKMRTKKTSVEIAIPLNLVFNGKAVQIINRYSSIELFAKIGSNSRVNSHLKILQKMAAISTKLTFHVARHTCATLLCHRGVPITTVQKILGHTKVSTTQIYQEVMSETIINDLRRANELSF